MDLNDEEESSNVEDRRGTGGRGIALGGVGTLVLIVLAVLFGVDPRQLLNQSSEGQAPDTRTEQQANQQDEALKHLSAVVLHDTETVWGDTFQKMGKKYRDPTLVLFTDSVDSACGQASAA